MAMKMRVPCILLAGAALASAGPDWITEGFEVPKVYKEGESVVGVGKTESGAGGWVLDDQRENQDANAFMATAAAPAAAPAGEAAKPDREAERAAREAQREKEKNLDREARKKAEEAREMAEQSAKVMAGLQTLPGVLALVDGQKNEQSIVRPLAEPLKAPFYFSIVFEPDYAKGGALSIGLEDEIADLPFVFTLKKSVEQSWQLSAGGAGGYLDCVGVKGRHFFIAGIEPDPKDRDKWVIKAVANPADLRNPFQGGVDKTTIKATMDFKEFTRLRITKAGRTAAKIDEIRVGKSLRDVLP